MERARSDLRLSQRQEADKVHTIAARIHHRTTRQVITVTDVISPQERKAHVHFYFRASTDFAPGDNIPAPRGARRDGNGSEMPPSTHDPFHRRFVPSGPPGVHLTQRGFSHRTCCGAKRSDSPFKVEGIGKEIVNCINFGIRDQRRISRMDRGGCCVPMHTLAARSMSRAGDGRDSHALDNPGGPNQCVEGDPRRTQGVQCEASLSGKILFGQRLDDGEDMVLEFAHARHIPEQAILVEASRQAVGPGKVQDDPVSTQRLDPVGGAWDVERGSADLVPGGRRRGRILGRNLPLDPLFRLPSGDLFDE